MTIHDRIRNGEFDNKLPLGSGPRNKEGQELSKAYRQENYRLRDIFQQALAEEYGMVGHHKEQLLFTKAWEDGHASGYYEVAYYYEYLLELAR